MSAAVQPLHPVPPAADSLCTVTLRVSNKALVTLQLLTAEIRFRTGANLTRTAILRGLIRWMETCEIDTRRIHSPDDLRDSLLLTLIGDRDS